MFEDSYLAECDLVYCSWASDKAFEEGNYFKASFYINMVLYCHLMLCTHGGY